MLAIEIDGRYHDHEDILIKDEARQTKLESFGVRFLRFAEAELKDDLENVLRAIEGAVVGIVKEDCSIKLPEGFDMSLLE